MPTSFRDRAYSAPPALSSLGMGYGWSPTYVQTGGGANPVTGSWIPTTVGTGGNLQVELANATFTGNLSVNTAPLELIETSGVKYLSSGVPTYFIGGSTVSNTTPSGINPFTSQTMITGQALAANGARQFLYIANTSVSFPLYILLGAGTTSTGKFNIVLSPATQTGCQGGIYTDERWKGSIQISGYGFNAWEY